MGEIKSTLDLIMERTKNLTMSEEERKAFREQEISGKVKGLVQRHLDGSISGERLREEVAALQAESGNAATVKHIFRAEILNRIRLGLDHTALLSMLSSGIGEDPAPIARIVQEQEREAERLGESRKQALRQKFGNKGISGTSVVPNLEADPEWRRGFQGLEEDMRAHLKAIAERLP